MKDLQFLLNMYDLLDKNYCEEPFYIFYNFTGKTFGKFSSLLHVYN